jgi:hypothetical protein
VDCWNRENLKEKERGNGSFRKEAKVRKGYEVKQRMDNDKRKEERKHLTAERERERERQR